MIRRDLGAFLMRLNFLESTSSRPVGAIWVSRHFMRYAAVQLTGPYVMLGCYLPALWIVLRRPNVASEPL